MPNGRYLCAQYTVLGLANEFTPVGLRPQDLPTQVHLAARSLVSAQADIVEERPEQRFQSPRRQMLQCAHGFSRPGSYDQKEILAHERGSPNLGRGI